MSKLYYMAAFIPSIREKFLVAKPKNICCFLDLIEHGLVVLNYLPDDNEDQTENITYKLYKGKKEEGIDMILDCFKENELDKYSNYKLILIFIHFYIKIVIDSEKPEIKYRNMDKKGLSELIICFLEDEEFMHQFNHLEERKLKHFLVKDLYKVKDKYMLSPLTYRVIKAFSKGLTIVQEHLKGSEFVCNDKVNEALLEIRIHH